jgi:hypothetical protein
MPVRGPTKSQIRIDQYLSNLSSLVIQNQSVFIAPKVFSIVPVDKQSDLYPVYNEDDWNTDEALERKDSTESAGSAYSLSDDNYLCKVFGFHKDIGDQLVDNAQSSPFNLQKEAMEFVTRKLLIKQEREFVTKYLAASVWGDDLAGTTDFDQFNEATSAPIKTIKDEIGNQILRTGIAPNTLVLGYNVFSNLSEHPDFVDRVKYSSSDAVTEQIMAKLFGVDRVMVAKSIVATGKGATKTNSFNFGNNMLLLFANPTPGLLTPSAGYTFSWKFAPFISGMGATIRKWYIDEKETTRIDGKVAFDMKIIAKDLGTLVTAAVA